MSLYKRKDLKNKFADVQKFTHAKISLELGHNNNVVLLELNGVFNLIKINYVGTIKSLKPGHLKLNINYNNNKKKIIISNPSRISLKNDILFEFKGRIQKLSKTKVFGWGQGNIIAEAVTPSETMEKFKNSQNIVGTSQDVFYSNYGIY